MILEVLPPVISSLTLFTASLFVSALWKPLSTSLRLFLSPLVLLLWPAFVDLVCWLFSQHVLPSRVRHYWLSWDVCCSSQTHAWGKSGAIFNFRMCLIGKGNGFSFNLLWVMNGFVTQMICEEGESGNRKLGRVSSLLRDPWEEKVLLVLNIVYRCDTWSHLPVSLRIKDIRAVRLTKLESLHCWAV